MSSENLDEKNRMLEKLDSEINQYLDSKLKSGEIREELYRQAKENVMKNVTKWLNDKYINEHSPGLIEGLFDAIKQRRWENIIYAFCDDITFGTAGIRGQACFNEDDVKKLTRFGIDAPIIRGPNTINNIVLLLKSAGLAKYAQENNLKSIVVGYDSRIRGKDFAELIAKLFLSFGIKVYLFDEACPYPELTFTIPTIGADLGVLISASHNDKRYNGYKVSSKTGAQIDLAQRNMIYNEYISKMTTQDIKFKDFKDAGKNLVFLGGSEKLPGVDYMDKDLIDMHTKHIHHMKNFIIDKKMFSRWVNELNVGFCAFYGAGCNAVPRVIKELGVKNIKVVSEMNRLDGTFPCFDIYQQPDPGDEIAERIAIELFKKEHSSEAFKNIDIMLATDPDADRVGFVTKVPENQKDVYREISKGSELLESSISKMIPDHKARNDYDWYLLTADEAFSLLLWYRLKKMKDMNNGVLPDSEKSFIVINHVTTDMITRLAKKYGIGVVKSWVGFTFISGCVEKIWNGEILNQEKDHSLLFSTIDMNKNRCINLGAIEQSNGFSILGNRPSPGKYLGENGHTRDKDGVLAATLFTEVAAYAKSQGKSLIELLDENLYLDPQIGFFANYAEACPYWGQFEGPTGFSKKIDILKRVEKLAQDFESGKELCFAGKKVVSIERYATGKYDKLHHWNGFFDEGIRFFFDSEKLNYMTVRPSGTSHCIRFHIQLHKSVSKKDLFEKKAETYNKAKEIIQATRKACNAS
jgi:phosphoglucomutase